MLVESSGKSAPPRLELDAPRVPRRFDNFDLCTADDVEPERIAAVVVALVVTYDIIVRALPELEGNPLLLQEVGERLAIFRPDLRDVTLTSRSIACPLGPRRPRPGRVVDFRALRS